MSSADGGPARDEALRLSVSRSGPESDSALDKAAQLLQQDQVVAFPTETVYGLGANALSSQAVDKIYKAKGRPSDNPLIVHVSDRDMLNSLLPNEGKLVPDMLTCLMDEFWPGPLTIIFQLATNNERDGVVEWREPRNKVAKQVSAGLESLAIRMPLHDLARNLIKRAGVPLAAPSANLSSRPSPTTAEHVWNDLGKGRGVAAILDDGSECQVGLESTVVDYIEPKFALETDSSKQRGGQLRVLRAGGISPEQLEQCLEKNGFATSLSSSSPSTIQVYNRDFKSKSIEAKPTTPGMKYKHYAPTNSRVVLVSPAHNDKEDDKSLPTIQDLISFSAFSSSSTSSRGGRGDERPFRVGLMLTDETLSRIKPLSSEPLPSSQSRQDKDVRLIKLGPTKTRPQDIPIPTPLVEPVVVKYEYGSRDDLKGLARKLFGGLRCLDELEFERTSVDEVTRSLSGVELKSVSRREEDEERGEGGGQELDKKGVDVIMLECVPESGVGLAVMERSRKAAGVAGDGQGMSFRL
ncbi:hypothetical protein ACM66B_002451 [Microbotryomycetes sp. NB124-2]